MTTRVRVDLRDVSPNASKEERDAAFKRMKDTFKRAVADAGILHNLKKYEFYESTGEKKRRKRKEANLERLKNKLRENFPEKYDRGNYAE